MKFKTTLLLMVMAELIAFSAVTPEISAQEPNLLLDLAIPSTARVCNHDNGVYVVGTSGGDLYVINEAGEYTVTQLGAGSINDVRIESPFIAVAAGNSVIELSLDGGLTPSELWRTTSSGWYKVVSTDLSEDGNYVTYLAQRHSSYVNAGEIGVLSGADGSLISSLYTSGYRPTNFWLDATGDMEYIAASHPTYPPYYRVGIGLYRFDGLALTFQWWTFGVPEYETTEVRISEAKDYVAAATSSGTYMKLLRLSDGAVLWSHNTPNKEQFACDGDDNLNFVIGANQKWSPPYRWFVLENLGSSYAVLAEGSMDGPINDLDSDAAASLLAFGSDHGEFILLSRSNSSVDTVYSATVDSVSRTIDAIEIGSHTLLVGGPQFIHLYGPRTPMLLKELAVNKLESILAVDVNDADLIDAIGYLHMSLGQDDERAGMSGSEVVWGDPSHVDDCHGGYKGVDVFQYEEAACDKLDAYLENDENADYPLIPNSIVFEILNTSCGLGDSFQFFLNGISLGTTAADPTNSCTCTLPIQTFSITDVGLLDLAWNVSGENTFRFVKTGSNNAFAWVRARIETGASSKTLCISDIDGGSCNVTDLCSAGYTFGSVDQSTSLPALFTTLPDQVEAVRVMLALADSMLAATAIAEAIAESGDPDEVAVAEALKAEGDAAKASGGTEICDIALDKYEEAWEKAVGSWCTSDNAAKVAEVSMPDVFALAQNYPNPFNPTTEISLSLPVATSWKITIFNIAGQKVKQFSGTSEAGVVTVTWDASRQASGIYLYKAEAGTFSDTKKMLLLK